MESELTSAKALNDLNSFPSQHPHIRLNQYDIISLAMRSTKLRPGR